MLHPPSSRLDPFPVAALKLLSRSQLCSVLLAGALGLAAAFSAAQTPPASDTPAAPTVRDTPDQVEIPGAADKPAPPDAAKRSAGDVDVALVLPLDAAPYARAADAVRAGFLAAAEAAGSRLKIRVFPHGNDEVLTAFEAARASGATVIVGPLVRDDVRTVASMSLELPMTLALNQLDDVTDAPPTFYSFALGVESDGRTIARRMRADNAQNIAVISADTLLMNRLAVAFTAEWTQGGGAVPDMHGFVATPEALIALRREIVKKRPDAALLALDGGSATQIKPYLGSTRAYASGLMFERDSPATLRDLDGLIIVEIPWLVVPQAPQFANLPRKEFASVALTRLYALGLDAFRVAQALRDGTSERLSFEGATGQITLGDGRSFQRDGLLAVFRAGQLVPLDGAR
ncbi:MAG: penicillin-binding protein activator [Betaproteobacteria bacterium]